MAFGWSPPALSFSIPARPALERVRPTLREGAAAARRWRRKFVLDLQGTLWRLRRRRQSGGDDRGLGDDRLPDVSRDGSRVVFQSYRSGTWDIWSMNADGSSAAAITSGPADDREPVLARWNPGRLLLGPIRELRHLGPRSRASS
jgi:hypothetical protein